MTFLVNGNFESGTIEPWKNIDGEALDWEVVSFNNKKWLHTYGLGHTLEGAFRQVIPKTEPLWGIHFRITFTAKAIPTGGTPDNRTQPDGGVNRLKSEMLYYFTLEPMFPDIWYPGGSADVSVVETTYSLRIVLTHFAPVIQGDLVMVNWAGDGYDKANILITDIKLEAVDPELDPEESSGDVRRIDLSPYGLPKLEVVRMKEIK